jgi:HPt (histidine-containing phosphotransfer) domain-containing protein
LTANAFAEDARNCIEAGMNEHLTKPIRKQILEAALGRYLAESAVEPATEALPVQAATTQRTVRLDDETWKNLLQDMPATAVRKLVSTFLANQPAEVAAMPGDLAANDRQAIKRRAHSLKSAARLFGALDLGDRASELEQVSLTADAGELGKRVEELAGLMAETGTELGRLLSGLTEAA